jgi:hypothetical protein
MSASAVDDHIQVFPNIGKKGSSDPDVRRVMSGNDENDLDVLAMPHAMTKEQQNSTGTKWTWLVITLAVIVVILIIVIVWYVLKENAVNQVEQPPVAYPPQRGRRRMHRGLPRNQPIACASDSEDSSNEPVANLSKPTKPTKPTPSRQDLEGLLNRINPHKQNTSGDKPRQTVSFTNPIEQPATQSKSAIPIQKVKVDAADDLNTVDNDNIDCNTVASFYTNLEQTMDIDVVDDDEAGDTGLDMND